MEEAANGHFPTSWRIFLLLPAAGRGRPCFLARLTAKHAAKGLRPKFSMRPCFQRRSSCVSSSDNECVMMNVAAAEAGRGRARLVHGGGCLQSVS